MTLASNMDVHSKQTVVLCYSEQTHWHLASRNSASQGQLRHQLSKESLFFVSKGIKLLQGFSRLWICFLSQWVQKTLIRYPIQFCWRTTKNIRIGSQSHVNAKIALSNPFRTMTTCIWRTLWKKMRKQKQAKIKQQRFQEECSQGLCVNCHGFNHINSRSETDTEKASAKGKKLKSERKCTDNWWLCHVKWNSNTFFQLERKQETVERTQPKSTFGETRCF